MEPIPFPARDARGSWLEIEPRAQSPRDSRRLATDAAAVELVGWARYLDPGADASDARRAVAVQALIDVADEPDALHDAWTAALRMLARGEVTRSVVGLLTDAMGAHEVAASA
jgi:hypothetical protein